jgi:hypothetical protein
MNMQALENGCSVTSLSMLGKWKACSSGIMHRTLSKQSLLVQVNAKLTPEICINNTSSYSRLTAMGRQATATDNHSQNGLQTLFFFSLPTFDEKITKLHLHAEKLTETVLHLNSGHFVGFFFLCYPFDDTTTEQHLRHHWRLRDEHQNY